MEIEKNLSQDQIASKIIQYMEMTSEYDWRVAYRLAEIFMINPDIRLGECLDYCRNHLLNIKHNMIKDGGATEAEKEIASELFYHAGEWAKTLHEYNYFFEQQEKIKNDRA